MSNISGPLAGFSDSFYDACFSVSVLWYLGQKLNDKWAIHSTIAPSDYKKLCSLLKRNEKKKKNIHSPFHPPTTPKWSTLIDSRSIHTHTCIGKSKAHILGNSIMQPSLYKSVNAVLWTLPQFGLELFMHGFEGLVAELCKGVAYALDTPSYFLILLLL